MSVITTCKVLNQSNKINNEEIVVCTAWSDLKIKILILRNNNTMLTGEMLFEEFNIYADTFEKTLKVYLKETKDILSGKNNEVEFFLDEQKFYWKRRIWALGRLNVKIITELDCLHDFTLLLIDQYSKIKTTALELEKNNENLKSNESKLICKLNEIIILKEELEKKLYTKFILIINTKKAKIRELKSKLELLERKESVFDAVTDESDNESNSQKISNTHSNLIKQSMNKQLVNEDNNQISRKRLKFEINVENMVNNKEKEIECTKSDVESKSNSSFSFNLEEDNDIPDLLSDESECEVELKFEEENLEDVSKYNLSTIVQEDSEEEMF